MSASYEIGDVVTLTFAVDVNGVPTDATVALTLTLPDASTLTPSTTRTSAGRYSYAYTATQNGNHTARWVASGAASAAETYTFTVGGLISLAEAKLQLGKTAVVDDVEVQDYIDSVTAAIEAEVGPVVPRSVTEWQDVSGSVIFLRQYPVISVTSVTGYSGATPATYALAADPTTVVTDSYYLDATSGMITIPGGWGNWRERVKVVYVAGRTATPPEINLAARLLVQALWRSQNGGAGLPALSDEPVDTQQVLWESIRSERVQMLLAPHRQHPVVA